MKSLGFGLGHEGLALSLPLCSPRAQLLNMHVEGERMSTEQSQNLALPAAKFTPDHPTESPDLVYGLFDERVRTKSFV